MTATTRGGSAHLKRKDCAGSVTRVAARSSSAAAAGSIRPRQSGSWVMAAAASARTFVGRFGKTGTRRVSNLLVGWVCWLTKAHWQPRQCRQQHRRALSGNKANCVCEHVQAPHVHKPGKAAMRTPGHTQPPKLASPAGAAPAPASTTWQAAPRQLQGRPAAGPGSAGWPMLCSAAVARQQHPAQHRGGDREGRQVESANKCETPQPRQHHRMPRRVLQPPRRCILPGQAAVESGAPDGGGGGDGGDDHDTATGAAAASAATGTGASAAAGDAANRCVISSGCF